MGLSPTTQTGKQPSLIFADDIGAVKKEAWLGFEHILIAHNRLALSIMPQSHTILLITYLLTHLRHAIPLAMLSGVKRSSKDA